MNFTTDQAQGLVLGACAGTFVLAVADDIAHGDPPSIRAAVGSFLVAAALYALADWVPALAGSLALLLLVGAILTNGVSVANVITGATAKS